MSATVDVIRRAFQEDGSFVEVRPWPDAPDSALELRTVRDDMSEAYFGPLSIALKADFARALGEALIKSANDLGEAK